MDSKINSAKHVDDHTILFEFLSRAKTPDKVQSITLVDMAPGLVRKRFVSEHVETLQPTPDLFPNFSVVADESGNVAGKVSPVVIVDNEGIELGMPRESTDGPDIAVGRVESVSDPLMPQAVRTQGSIKVRISPELARQLANTFPSEPE